MVRYLVVNLSINLNFFLLSIGSGFVKLVDMLVVQNKVYINTNLINILKSHISVPIANLLALQPNAFTIIILKVSGQPMFVCLSGRLFWIFHAFERGGN